MRKRWFYRVAPLALIPGLLFSTWTSTRADSPRPTGKAFVGVAIEASKDGKETGVHIREVSPDGPAAKAGLMNGDRIIKVEDREIKDPGTLLEMIASHKPGDALKLKYARDGKEHDCMVTLSERPLAKTPNVRDLLGDRQHAYLGVRANGMNSELKQKLGATVDQGVVVVEVMADTPAAKAGLKTDDIITKVNDQSVSNPKELIAVIQKTGAGKDATLNVIRGKESLELKAKLENAPLGWAGLHQFNPPWMFEMDTLPPGFDSDPRFQEMKKRMEEWHKRLRNHEEKESN